MMGAIHTAIYSAACVPLTLVRKIVKTGIVQLKSLFRIVVFCAGPGNDVLNELTGLVERQMAGYFQFVGLE